TMPHKRNPHKSERICSLARLLKSNVIPALDNIILEDERDLTNSANERIIFSENFILLDFMISQLTDIIQGLEFNEFNIEKNLNLTKGASLVEKVMVNLVKKGIGRQEGHELLRKAVIKAKNENKIINEILSNNPKIQAILSKSEVDELLDPHNYIGKALEQTENLLNVLNNKYTL
ncbi:MAG: adenylosuccinate lyase, partial [Promethearchaeota archaeon]